MNIANVASAPDLGAKAAHLWRWAVPSPAKLRRLEGDAADGPFGLLRAYVRHLVRWPQVVVAYRDWRRLNGRDRW